MQVIERTYGALDAEGTAGAHPAPDLEDPMQDGPGKAGLDMLLLRFLSSQHL